MKNVLKTIALTFALMFGTMALAGESYICKSFFLGGCKTLYTGTTSVEDAVLYLDQTRTLMGQIVNETPSVAHATYDPKAGQVILVQSHGYKDRPDLKAVANRFAQARLRITSIYLVTERSEVLNRRKVVRDFGGDSRFWALEKVRIPGEYRHPITVFKTAG